MDPKEDKIAALTREIERLEKELGTSQGSDYALSGAYRDRARVFHREGNLRDAIVDYEKAIAQAIASNMFYPTLGDTYSNLGDILFQIENYDKARGNYRLAQHEYKKNLVNDDMSLLPNKIAKCYAYGGLVKCQQGDWSGGCSDFERVFQEATYEHDGSFIFSDLLKDNPQCVVARILSALYSYGGLSISDELFREIKASPQTAHELLKHWNPTGRSYEEAQVLKAVAIYEVGDVPGALQAIKNIFLIGKIRTDDSQEPTDEVEKRVMIPIYSLFGKSHPVGEFGAAYLYCQQGHVYTTLQIYEEMLKVYPNQPLVQEGINEALQLAPQAIERHIEREEFHIAADLAERLGDFAYAGEWYEITAIRLEEEKGDKESVTATYQKAAECFSKAGDEARARPCWGNVHRLRQQAELKVIIDTPESLVVGEWDALSITVVNTGFGPAENLSAKVEGPVTVHNMSESNAIAAGERKMIEIPLRFNEPGRRVPITVRIVYQDSTGEHALPSTMKLIPVSASEAH